MDVSKLKKLNPTVENWDEIIKQVGDMLLNQPDRIDWDELILAVSHFPDEMRGAHHYTQKWSTQELEPLLRLMTTMRVHRATYTAKFGRFCRSRCVNNIKKIALDYRDSDDNYVSISALLKNRHFKSLEYLRLKHYVLTERELDLFVENIDCFRLLKRVDLLGGESGYNEFSAVLSQHDIEVTQAKSYREFVDRGYDFWK